MKKLVIALFFILLALPSFATEKKGFVINGEIENLKTGTIYLQSFRNKMFFNVDSAKIINGKFTFKGSVKLPLLYGLATKDMEYPVQLFVENTTFSVKISADREHIKTVNSPANDLFIGDGEAVQQDNYNIDSLVTKNPSSNVAAYFFYRHFLYRLPLNKIKEIRGKLAPELAASPYVQSLDEIIKTLEKVQIGSVAPDFSLPDSTGLSISLSSFKGKYVLIDFWASWCGPCRRENPNVVKAFNEFKDKNFTVLGISLDKNKTAWLKAIQHDGLTWTHLSDLKYWDSAAAKLYGIRAIPSNVLIDPQGIIIGKDLREEELHTKLNEILK